MLLHIMPLSRYIRADDLAVRQANLRCFSLARIRLFGLGDADFEANTFCGRSVVHGRGLGAAFLLRWAPSEADLVEGGQGMGRGCKCAVLELVREDDAVGCADFEVRSGIDKGAQRAECGKRW